MGERGRERERVEERVKNGHRYWPPGEANGLKDDAQR